jgi:DNA-binding CsgD family transcriptional regulator
VNRRWVIAVILAVQALCAAFFMSDILSSLIGLRTTPISWQTREMIEIGAAVGLILGLVLGAIALRRADRARVAAEERLRRAQAAFSDLLDERFRDWSLTPAEADVALFAIKGMSTAEIAALRKVSEGTVKAQTAAIYRKAGVTGRPQLLSLFIEDLMRDGPDAAAPVTPEASAPG